MALIHVRDLTKSFQRTVVPEGRFESVRRLFSGRSVTTTAVDHVSFDIDAGETVGYLGANGAGKSTTIKMLTGILVPTSGSVEVAGHVPWRDRKVNAIGIGVVFGQRSQLWYDLPLRDSFELIRDLYGIDPADYRARLGMFGELLDLGSFMDTPVRFLSLGQRMRGDLTAALLHAPGVVYLDEPTVGLDVIAKRRIREFIGEINREWGTTVILTTHDMDDVEAVCSRIIMIDAGKVLYDGTLSELKHRWATERELRVSPGEGVDPSEISVPGTICAVESGAVVIRWDPAVLSTPELIQQVTSRWPVSDLAVSEASLTDIVSRIYTEIAAGKSTTSGGGEP